MASASTPRVRPECDKVRLVGLSAAPDGHVAVVGAGTGESDQDGVRVDERGQGHHLRVQRFTGAVDGDGLQAIKLTGVTRL